MLCSSHDSPYPEIISSLPARSGRRKSPVTMSVRPGAQADMSVCDRASDITRGYKYEAASLDFYPWEEVCDGPWPLHR